MTSLSDFHFLRPGWLLLLPGVVWLWWVGRRSSDPLLGWRGTVDPALLTALTVGADAGSRWRESGLLLGWLAAVVAVAGPSWRPEPSPFVDDPQAVMIVLRASQTMELADLAPSRMERARLKVADLASARKGLPMGLLAYAGSSHLVLPPTRDTAVVASMAAEISPEIMPRPGDDLAGALELAAQTLGDQPGSAVLIADTMADNTAAVLADFRRRNQLPVQILAVARAETPEFEAIDRAAQQLDATVIPIASDRSDVDELVRRTSRPSVAVAAAGEAIRWAEAGWWLTPILALLSLSTFRRVVQSTAEERQA